MTKKLILFTPYFRAKTAERQLELDFCLQKNLACKEIDKVILLIDDKHQPPFTDERLEIINIEARPSYQLWARLSHEYAKDAISILANTDIYFDTSVSELRHIFYEPNRFLALSRYDKKGITCTPHPNPKWSQDCWAYDVKDSIQGGLLDSLDIPMGVPRCDNKVAYLFAIHGWRVCNPFAQVRITHVHETNQRNYNKKTDLTVIGAVAYVYPTNDLADTSKLEIDIWARGTDAIQSVSLNRSLDRWHEEQRDEASLVPNFKLRPPEIDPLIEVKFTGEINLATHLKKPVKPPALTDLAETIHARSHSQSIGRAVWTDPLRRFSIRELNGHLYALDWLLCPRPQLLRDSQLMLSSAMTPEVILNAFVPPVLDTAPITFLDRPRSKEDCHFWQYPAATERQAWQNHIDIARGANQDLASHTVHIYLPIPWATYIDKKKLPEDVLSIFVPRISGLHRLARSVGWKLRVHTVCQHIYWKKILKMLQRLGVTDLHLSHATNDIDPINDGELMSMRIHSWPLFAPNIEVPERRLGLTVEKPFVCRQYLASFIGAHMPHYRSNVRVDLLLAAKALNLDNILVELTDIWHFNKVVFEEQVMNKQLTKAQETDATFANQRYNEVLSDSRFSLCPDGAGPNTLRFWESIALGCVPVLFNRTLAFPSSFSTALTNLCVFWEQDEYGQPFYTWLKSFTPQHLEQRSQELKAIYIKAKQLTCF